MTDLELVYGFVTEVRRAPLRIRARLPDMDDMVSPWSLVLTPRSHGDKQLDVPVVGEQVALLLMDHGESGLCLGSTFSEVDPDPAGPVFQRVFADGTVICYDPDSHHLSVSAVDQITVSAQRITWDAEVTITKGLTVNDDAVIGGKSFLTHPHSDVTPGSGNSGPPA